MEIGQSSDYGKFKAAVITSMAVLMAAIGVADILTGAQISLWVFYLVPITATAFLFGTRKAILFSVIAGVLMLVSARITGYPYSSLAFFMFAWACRTTVFMLVSFLTPLARATLLLQLDQCDENRAW